MVNDLRIKNVVDRFISVEIARELNKDAGYRAEHQLGRIIDYMGDLPEGGQGGNSNGAMIYQVSMMFKEPDDPQTMWTCKAMRFLERKSEKQYKALVAWVLFSNRPDPENECDYHTKERIAVLVGMSRSAFHNNLEAGKRFIAELIELSECGAVCS
ncbi:hypothetical protein [Amphritea sp. HPY]|uniref:hypothetical protein n=1 Tax=Amphritea sp. HPY TaxID=3421652 RepID=UPI003D7CB4A8